MTARIVNQRWWIWLPLLSVAALLALFGDKTPKDAVVPARVAAKVNSSNGKSGSNSMPPSNRPVSASTKASGTSSPSDPSTGSTGSSSKSLEALVPREQLILSVQAQKPQTRDLFSSTGWNPPPPKPLPPPPPSAPALPFTFLGKKLEGGTWEVFLARGEQSFVVREGDVIENTYRIENISPPNLNLNYLPLGQSQSLVIGNSQ